MFRKLACSIAFFVFLAVHVQANTILRFGILPVIDTLPLQVAVKEGYFAEQGLEVELVPFTSAMERNTAVHSGQLDGMFGDLIATLLLAEKGLPIHILTVSYHTQAELPMFGLVTSPALSSEALQSPLTVAISKATIIEYLLTYIRELEGARRFDYEPVEIKQMPIRLQMLLTGRIDSALLPEPLLTLALSRGANLLATDQSLSMPLTVLNLVGDQAAYSEPFLAAYAKAVNALNQSPEAYRLLMAETCRIPKALVSTFPIYTYPQPRQPTKAEVDQVQEWMLGKDLLKKRIPYARLVE